MKILIVHAHHEPKSFSSSLFQQTVKTFTELGHDVMTSDLYKIEFDPISDRRNWTSVKDPEYLKQQVEERYASEVGGFSPELEVEIRKLESCDMLIFNFPLWWFGMPAIMKGWVDRAFPMGRIYGSGKIYENGIGKAKKRAIVITTTGGGEVTYSQVGFNPELYEMLIPIHHGIFWFNGFLTLEPFVAWSPAHISLEEKSDYLKKLDLRLRSIEKETPLTFPPLKDFPGMSKDSKKRFMVTITHKIAPDEKYQQLRPAELERVEELKRLGIILSNHVTVADSKDWKGFLLIRETDESEVKKHLESLPLASYLAFEITELNS